jgi:hypothetical protein
LWTWGGDRFNQANARCSPTAFSKRAQYYSIVQMLLLDLDGETDLRPLMRALVESTTEIRASDFWLRGHRALPSDLIRFAFLFFFPLSAV